MNNDLPVLNSDFLYIEPIESKQIVGNALKTIGKVLAIGEDLKIQAKPFIKVGDYVAFELWDKPEFQLKDGKMAHFVREKDVICKVPESWL